LYTQLLDALSFKAIVLISLFRNICQKTGKSGRNKVNKLDNSNESGNIRIFTQDTQGSLSQNIGGAAAPPAPPPEPSLHKIDIDTGATYEKR